MQCGVCGGMSFTAQKALWEQLISDWQLSEAEVKYIDRQQGESCSQCGANIRSIALANAIRSFLRTNALLSEFAHSALAKNVEILEINEAGNLSPMLRMFGKHVFGSYPEVDIHSLPYGDSTFDLVIHSDTLEHVPNPIHALGECRRVLKPGGALCFTVPTVVGRMSRDRAGLAKSYHGNSGVAADDFAVQTEFGADVWTYVLEAGFTNVSIHSFCYPAGIAFMARA